MNKKSMSIICNNCGNTVVVVNGDNIDDNSSIEVYSTIYETVKIVCECGNKVEINEY